MKYVTKLKSFLESAILIILVPNETYFKKKIFSISEEVFEIYHTITLKIHITNIIHAFCRLQYPGSLRFLFGINLSHTFIIFI